MDRIDRFKAVMMEERRRFHHVGIVVRDLEASVAWYERHLGFQLQRRYAIMSGTVAHIGRENLRLELLQIIGASPMAADRKEPTTYLRTGGVNHFAIGVDDLDGMVADLKAKGVDIAWPPSTGPEGSHVRFAFIWDGERTLVELIQEMD